MFFLFCVHRADHSIPTQLHHQSQATTSISPIVSTGLHGREIRAVKMQSFEIGGERVVLVATAAENGVLAISRREPSPAILDTSVD